MTENEKYKQLEKFYQCGFPSTNDEAITCLKRYYLWLQNESPDLLCEFGDRPLLYLTQLICFRMSFLDKDFLECWRQIDGLLVITKLTINVKTNLLYLFHETLDNMAKV